MTTLSEDIDYLAVETQSESNDGRASAATWEHEDLAQARRNYDRYILKNITVLNVLFIFIQKINVNDVIVEKLAGNMLLCGCY